MNQLNPNPPTSVRVMVDGVWAQTAGSFQWSDARTFVAFFGPGLKFLIAFEKIPPPPS
jgi:hypothetical protein